MGKRVLNKSRGENLRDRVKQDIKRKLFVIAFIPDWRPYPIDPFSLGKLFSRRVILYASIGIRSNGYWHQCGSGLNLYIDPDPVTEPFFFLSKQ